MNKALHISGQWLNGHGSILTSQNPSTGKNIWTATAASLEQVDLAVQSAQKAQAAWQKTPLKERKNIIQHFAELLSKEENKIQLATIISQESGKPFWESQAEVNAMIGKIAISFDAYDERTSSLDFPMPNSNSKAILRHKPHGVIAIFGPYNFPGHLPNGHIVPALLAGNTVIFKPSELTPMVAEFTIKIWEQTDLIAGALNLVHGGKDIGIALAQHKSIDGLFFTGSSNTGKLLHQHFAGNPSKILALEMGGNNPLIVDEVSNIDAAIHDTIMSSFVSSGQRCTCARRLFVPNTSWGDTFINKLKNTTEKLIIGCWNDKPAPFMGPVINEEAANSILSTQDMLVNLGGAALMVAKKSHGGTGFVSPSIIDVTSIDDSPDEEYFGPLLQIIRYSNFQEAINHANNTRYGLSAGLFSDDPILYEQFFHEIRAGIINWNKPLTGASSKLPFGGVGDSGNYRPSALYAADYCAYPISSIESKQLEIPQTLSPGLTL